MPARFKSEPVCDQGEAEAYAAQLNASGLVDAVVTDDSDAFCYGASTVLRNFAGTSSVHDR